VVVDTAGTGYTRPSVRIDDPEETLLATYWSNDGTATNGNRPTEPVTLNVADGLFSVLLGDMTLSNMTLLPSTVFTHPEVYLRIWFRGSGMGIAQLRPDQRIAAVGYAMMAGQVIDGSITSSSVAPGAITSTHLAPASVLGSKIATGEIGSTHLAASSVTGTQLADDSVASRHLTSGAVGSAQLALNAIASGHLRDGAVQSNHVAAGAIHAVHLASDLVFTNGSPGLGAGVPHGGIVLGSTANDPNFTVLGYVPAGSMESGQAWREMTKAGAPAPANYVVAVWTGTEMLVHSSYGGGRYNPSTGIWKPMSGANAPTVGFRSATWTGSEMILWGDLGIDTSQGYRYRPASDTWQACSTNSAPSPRQHFSTVWTGTRLIVWGGYGPTGVSNKWSLYNSGYSYDPTNDTWTVISTNSAPAPRLYHSAVWTGSEMIIWGGGTNLIGYGQRFQDGARYRPASDTWTSMASSGAAEPRSAHTAVWTGSEMLVWGGATHGGATISSGGRYRPASNSWLSVSEAGVPAARKSHAGHWTGSKLLVWGGIADADVYLKSGGQYDPVTDSWQATPLMGAPSGRSVFGSVWTGNEFLLWGGFTAYSTETDDGYSYDPNMGWFYLYRQP
jgi:N-acetylneuraminic acid mutarotase